LLQEKSGVKHPIAFASRKLLLREVHYSTIEKEYLEIDWAIKKLQNFLYRKSFILKTDHEPLPYQYQNGRLVKWALTIQQYQFTVRVTEGSDNVGADFYHATLGQHGIRHRCVSVCVSVTLRYCIKIAKRRITQIMAHDITEILVSDAKEPQNSNSITRYWGAKCKWSRLKSAAFDE